MKTFQKLFPIQFSKPIIDSIDTLYFELDLGSPNNSEDVIYECSSFNYKYVTEKDDVKYTFLGFFYETTFLILIDSFHKIHKVKIEHKDIFMIPFQKDIVELDGKSYFVASFKEKSYQLTVTHFTNRRSIKMLMSCSYPVSEWLYIYPSETLIVQKIDDPSQNSDAKPEGKQLINPEKKNLFTKSKQLIIEKSKKILNLLVKEKM